MSNFFAQVAAITSMNLRNLPERKASTIVALVGIVGVVAVLVGVLAIREGFREVLDLSGSEDVAIVLRGGSTDEMSSSMLQDQTRIIADAPDVARDSAGPLASPELYVVVDVPIRKTNTPANVPLRGVSPQGPKLREAFKIVAGRTFTPGTFEMIVGRGAALQFAGLEVGRRIRWGTTEWAIVGIFEDDGSVAESEVWTDANVLQGAYRRGTTFQSTRVKLTSPQALRTFKDALSQDPRVNVRVYSEREFYEQQSRPLVTTVNVVGNSIALLMGIGAIFGALNTMYSAVSARTREIATLRAIGFSAGPVVISVLVEAMVIGVLGGVLGCIIGWLGFDGIRTATLNPATFSQITFAFNVTPALLVQGLVYALILGFIGGLLPSLRAARLPITTGLREM
ncbi:MAG TPA: FtsX-like permease family protein [Steroidobacteraceae bacterium]|nr:FtsX-like permease family protein [Steroidobacteraceae bacterium]